MGWRDGPSGKGNRSLDRLPSSRNVRGWDDHDKCPVTANKYGYTECVLAEGHRGSHRDEEGVTWGDEDAIY